MARRPDAAYALTTPTPGREALLFRLAAFVAALPRGDGLRVEGRLDGTPLLLVPLGERARAGLAALAAETPDDLVERPVPSPPAPRPGGREERWGRLVHLGPAGPLPGPERSGERRGDASSGSGLHRLRQPVSANAWVAVQVHWTPQGAGLLAVRARYRLAAPVGAAAAEAVRASAALTSGLGDGTRVEWTRPSWRARRRWARGAPNAAAAGGGPVPATTAVRLLEPIVPRPFPSSAERAHHLVLFGASGSGKTTFLARQAVDAILRRRSVLVFDLHGDLGPLIAAHLPRSARGRLIALDPTGGPGPGVAVLESGGDPERTAAHVVAALKRLTGEDGAVYWGFRLERAFDTMVRAAQEQGGSLLDVFDLLTDADRREAARLSTREPAVARYLEELPAILRRNPEYLAPAAARLARIALSTRLAALLAPAADAAIAVGPLVDAGRALVVRLPIGELGPEASGFAATLLLTRLYLELVAHRPSRPVGLLVDEAQAVSPRLLAEVLAEGRKFGVEAIVATQFPDRLAPELRAAAAGSAGTHLVFRLPAPAARTVAPWVGLSIAEAVDLVPRLADGWAIVAGGGHAGVRLTAPVAGRPAARTDPWPEVVAATRAAFGTGTPPDGVGLDRLDEALLLDLYAARGPSDPAGLIRRVAVAAGADPPALLERLGGLEREGLVRRDAEAVRLTAAGARRLGAGAEHGSTVEGLEHRQLLLEAVRVFAAHGERVELVRQGRFDSRLPDGRLRLVGPEAARLPPIALVRVLAERERSWAWRHFGGRDVHLEAEVSGAERPERIRRGYQKAERAGAVVVFLVADARRARRVRATLARVGADPRRARVWTLPSARLRHGLDP
jgi:DNA helicase HerA-like ATPase